MKKHVSINIYGASGTGKSYLTLYLIEQMFPLKKFAVIVDIKSEYDNLTKLGFKKSIWTREMVARINVESAVKILLVNPRLIITPYLLSFEEEIKVIDSFAGACLYLGDSLFVGEECLDYLSGILDNETQRNLGMLVRRGRSVGVDSIWVYQRLGLINKLILSQANIQITFRVSEINDLQRITWLFEKSKEEISSLRPKTYYLRDLNEAKTYLYSTQGLYVRTKHGG